jgi:DNA-binding response OmpR family regulator
MTIPLQSSRCDVLIVDDEVVLAATIARSLTRDGMDVRSAHSGSSALHVVESYRPRVALLDYRLPDMTGVELAAKLHALLPELSIILMSGMVNDGGDVTLENIGIKVFVNKPVPLAPLKQAVRRLLSANRG